MGINNIEKKSLPYNILWHYAFFWHNKIFYKKIYVLNAKNIPNNKPLIFTANHQNALMDALALLFNIKKQLVFMARADMFNNKIIAPILYFLKILPIFRIRDGVEAVKKNDSIFNKTVEVIAGNNGLVILPEGNHAGVHHLRPLKKGFARIAFQTEAAHNFTMHIHIVPVGIEYSNYEDCRSTLIVNFGRAISVKDYEQQYRESPVHAINALKEKLSERIREVMLNIDSKRFYSLFDQLRHIYRKKMFSILSIQEQTHPNALKADQTLIDALSESENRNPEHLLDIEKKVVILNRSMEKVQVSLDMLNANQLPFYKITGYFLLLLTTSPLFLYGRINNFIPYYITTLISEKIKDPQFRSSIKYGLAIVLFPVLYLLQSLLFYNYSLQATLTLAYFISLPFSGILAWLYKTWADRFKMHWRLWALSKKKSSGLNSIRELRDQIIGDLDEIVLPYLGTR